MADLKKIAPLDNLVPLVNLYKKPIDEKVLKYYNHIKRKHKGENPIKIIQEKIAEIHSDLEKYTQWQNSGKGNWENQIKWTKEK